MKIAGGFLAQREREREGARSIFPFVAKTEQPTNKQLTFENRVAFYYHLTWPSLCRMAFVIVVTAYSPSALSAANRHNRIEKEELEVINLSTGSFSVRKGRDDSGSLFLWA